MSRIVDIADAMVEAINGASWPAEFTARRAFDPKYNLARGELDALKVDVVPNGDGVDQVDDRSGRMRHVYTLDVAIARKVTSTEGPEIEALVDLSEAMADFLKLKNFGGFGVCIKPDCDPVYNKELLAQKHVFGSIVTVEVVAWR